MPRFLTTITTEYGVTKSTDEFDTALDAVVDAIDNHENISHTTDFMSIVVSTKRVK